MQWLAAVCVKRPVFTWVLILLLVVVGLASILGLGIDRFPNIDFPVVAVTTELPGASPEQVETEVSDKLEEQINTISGLEELRSISYEGLSIVIAKFELEKDTAEAAQEVRDRVNRTLASLPIEAKQPRVERMDPDATPIMLIALQGPRSAREMTEYAYRRIRRQLESINGVGGVTLVGGQQRQINITLDPNRLQSFGLTPADVQRALATQNVEIPGGIIHQGATEHQVRVQGRLEDIQRFNELTLATHNGLSIRLQDVGQAADSEAEPASLATINGRNTVILAARKQSGTNTVAVIDGLRERIDEMRLRLPAGFRLEVVRDESEFIRNAIHAVEEHLILGSLFAALVVLIFLWNGRSTLISALAIPTSIISTFALIKAMGLTLNTITLLALTLAVGIVIDDAIVVLENIVKFIEEKGLSPRRAAILATKEIGLAVLATTLSLIAVFLPVAFMGGIVGRFMKSFGFTMSFSIAVSLLVSFTLTPMLSSRWLKPTGKAHPKEVEPEPTDVEPIDAEWIDPTPEPRAEEKAQYREWRHGTRVLPAAHLASEHGARKGIYALLEQGYMRLLALVMGRRWIVGIAMVGVVVAIFPLAKIVQKNFLPLDDESRFEIVVRAPEGTSLAQTQVIADRVARGVRELQGVAYTVTTAGGPAGNNTSSIFVALVDPAKRSANQQKVMGQVRSQILPRFRSDNLRMAVQPVNVFGAASASDSASIQFVVRGPELDKLTEYSQRLLEVLKKVPGVVDADTTLVTGKPEYALEINRARAADLDVSVLDIANALRLLVGDVKVSTFNEGGEQYEVHLLGNDRFRSDPAVLETTMVPAAQGRSVRLADVVTFHEQTGPSSIMRLSRQRQVTVYGNVVPGISEAAVISQLTTAANALHMDPGYTGELAGRSKELGTAFRNFLIALVLSLTFMYLVLAAQFESWIHPITILISLPLTVPFALFSLVFLNQSMNIFSTLGILVLFGIVKKNSILQIDHMRQLRQKGLSRADAVMVGNRDRLRPILMTTVAFVAGMIPLVISSGAGAGTNRAMGSVIIGGQSLSLLLTLLATPVMYSVFDDVAHSRVKRIAGGIVMFPFRMLDRLFQRTKSNGERQENLDGRIDNAAE